MRELNTRVGPVVGAPAEGTPEADRRLPDAGVRHG
jgi:hypothetical protein